MQINPLNIDAIISKIEEQKPFMFLKILHGFWEKIHVIAPQKNLTEIRLILSQIYSNNPISNIETCKYYPKINPLYEKFIDKGVIDITDRHYLELIDMLQEKFDNVILGVHYNGRSDVENIHAHKAIDAMNAIIPPDLSVYDGTLFKDACISGKITSFFDSIKKFRVVVIGLYHLEKINTFLRFKNFDFFGVECPLSPTRYEFIDKIKLFHANLPKDKPIIYLVQLGGSLAAWAGFKLNNYLKDAYFIDMGRVLDIWGDEQTPDQIWLNSITKQQMQIYRKKSIQFL